jgi:hypothetical protein
MFDWNETREVLFEACEVSAPLITNPRYMSRLCTFRCVLKPVLALLIASDEALLITSDEDSQVLFLWTRPNFRPMLRHCKGIYVKKKKRNLKFNFKSQW